MTAQASRHDGKTCTLRVVAEQQPWDNALSQLPNAHALQSWNWGEFKGDWGWQPQRLIFERQETPAAAAQMLHRRLPRLPLQVSYVPKGPALDFSDLALADEVLAALESEARRRRSIFVKIDPDLWLGTGTDMSQINAQA